MKHKQSLLKISEVCEQTGLSPRTVRYYEELGLLPNAHRLNGGRRVYGPDEIERLFFIQRLKTLGLTLLEIKQLNAVYAIAGSTSQMLKRLDVLLSERLIDLDDRIRQLTDLRQEILDYRKHIEGRIKRIQKGDKGS